MRYLKKFKSFESVEVGVSDEPDVKLAKEELNKLEKNIKDFPSIKTELDKAFAQLKGDKDNKLLNKRIDEIKKKFPDKDYTRLINFQVRLRYIQDELMKYDDDLFRNEEELKEIIKYKGDVTQKSKTISDIKSKQKIKTQEISDLKKDIIEAEAGLKTKMEEVKSKIQDFSKKITSI